LIFERRAIDLTINKIHDRTALGDHLECSTRDRVRAAIVSTRSNAVIWSGSNVLKNRGAIAPQLRSTSRWCENSQTGNGFKIVSHTAVS